MFTHTDISIYIFEHIYMSYYCFECFRCRTVSQMKAALSLSRHQSLLDTE